MLWGFLNGDKNSIEILKLTNFGVLEMPVYCCAWLCKWMSNFSSLFFLVAFLVKIEKLDLRGWGYQNLVILFWSLQISGHDNEVHRQIQLWGSEIALDVQGLFISTWVFVPSSGLEEVIVMHYSCSAKFFEETVSSGNFSLNLFV